jgi:glycosyltransferase involved in cell wall biosynthesis
MKIIVNINPGLNTAVPEYYRFEIEVLNELMRRQASQQFFIICHRPYAKHVHPSPQVTFLFRRHPRNSLLLKWWYNWRLGGLFRRMKPDLFLSFDGDCAPRANMPQCILLHRCTMSLSGIHSNGNHSPYSNTIRPNTLRRMNMMLCGSNSQKSQLVSRYGLDPGRMLVLPIAPNSEFEPIGIAQQEMIRSNLTGSKNFFLFSADIQESVQLILLLKAFSVFKKRQKSDWKLVIAHSNSRGEIEILKTLKNYRFRDDVMVYRSPSAKEWVMLTGAAYAFVYPAYWNGRDPALLNAMKAGVAVICSDDEASKEITRGAAVYANVSDYKDIADKMMAIYKDERMRQQMILKGLEASGGYGVGEAADILWSAMKKAVDPASKTVH